MTTLKLSNSKIEVVIDEEDLDRLSRFRWYHSGNLDRPSIRRSESVKESRSLYSNGRRTINISLSSEIMNNRIKKFDHKDRNPYNFSKSNLRECNNSQNAANRNKPRCCSSKYKGVTFYTKRNLWLAQIMKDGKNNNLGYFKIEEDAAKVYDLKAIELFGEFACINFPQK